MKPVWTGAGCVAVDAENGLRVWNESGELTAQAKGDSTTMMEIGLGFMAAARELRAKETLK